VPQDVPLDERDEPLTVPGVRVPGSAGGPSGQHDAIPGGAAAGDPPGEMPGRGPAGPFEPGDQHAFERWGWWWDIYFALVLAATLFVVGQASETAAQRAVAAVLLLATAGLYVALGRRVIAGRATGRAGNLFPVGIVALFMAAQGLVGNSGWALFALIPLCFMSAPLRRAIPAVLVLNLTPVLWLLEPARRTEGEGVSAAITIAVTGSAFSVAFGTWVTKIIDQSVERAELIRRLEAAQAELAEVNHRAGTLAERQRLAGEIHDTLAQGLSSIVMLLQAAEPKIATDPDAAGRHVGLATQTAKEGLAEARAMVAALTPTHLETDTLQGALRRLTERIGAELAVDARFELHGAARQLPATVDVVLLRVGQEALANVRKHSGAHQVRVELSYREDTAGLEVVDDGTGFDPGQVNGGYGLRGMRARIVQAGGRFDIHARPGAGTALSVEVPG
jgi:signal transduction histidine kinase